VSIVLFELPSGVPLKQNFNFSNAVGSAITAAGRPHPACGRVRPRQQRYHILVCNFIPGLVHSVFALRSVATLNFFYGERGLIRLPSLHEKAHTKKAILGAHKITFLPKNQPLQNTIELLCLGSYGC